MSLVEGDRIWVSAGLRVCEVISVSSNYLFLPKDRFALFFIDIFSNLCKHLRLFLPATFLLFAKGENSFKKHQSATFF